MRVLSLEAYATHLFALHFLIFPNLVPPTVG